MTSLRLNVLLLVVAGVLSSTQNSIDTEKDDEDPESDGVFHPTREWQEVRDGQSIPPGLHVRMDLQTGIKEAKLMDGADVNNNAYDVSTSGGSFGDPRRRHHYGRSDRRGIINKSTRAFTRKQLSEMLEKLNKEESKPGADVPLLSISSSSSIPYSSSSSSSSPSTAERNRHDTDHTTLSSIDLPSLEEVSHLLSVHSEVELMLEHTHTLAKAQDTAPNELVTALEELEYHVHQIDNAKDLDTIGGLRIVVLLLNHSDSAVASAAAHVVGSAVQSNPSVQTQALSYGALPSLLPLLTPSQPELLQRRAIFALSALLRGQPSTTKRFLKGEGVKLLSNRAEQRSVTVLTKLVILLTDLLSMECTEQPPQEETGACSLAQQLSQLGWCEHSTTLITPDRKLNTCEKGLHLMRFLATHCDFSSHSGRLEQLREELSQQQLEEEEEESELWELVTVVKDIISTIRTRTNSAKIEL